MITFKNWNKIHTIREKTHTIESLYSLKIKISCISDDDVKFNY